MLRIGFIGTGEIAAIHAGNLSRLADVRVSGAFDVIPEKAERFAQPYDATAYSSLEAMLAEVDAVYICTPPRFHCEAAVRAAEAGVHIFCEKPITASVTEAETVQAAVERADIKFMVGFNFRFTPIFMRFKDLVASEVLGDIYSFWGVRVIWLPHLAPNWRTDPRFICGMTIESLSHDFDFMRWLVGDVTSVMGRVATSRPDLDGYDNITSAIMTLKAGGMASFHSSWASHVGSTQYGVMGSLGTAIFDRGVIRWKSQDQNSENIIECNRPEDKVSSHQRETEYFIECLQMGETPFIGVRDGVATVRISHAVLQSAQEQRVVQVAT